MVEAYNFLNGTQTDINRRLLRKIEALESGESGESADITVLKTTVGDEDSGLVKDVADLKSAIGDEDSGLIKDVMNNTQDIGDGETPDTLIYDVEDLKNYIAEIIITNDLTDPKQ